MESLEVVKAPTHLYDLLLEYALTVSSRTVFYRKLKSIVGLTPVDFVCEMRIKRAAQLIEKSEYSFSQIAYMTGFNDPKYFSRRFKKIMGVTPTEYKERKGDAS